LLKELNALSAQLAPILQGQSDEIAKLERLIEQKHESDAFKLSAQLTDLQKKIAEASVRHSQLEASEASLKGRLQEIREQVEQSVEAFKVPQAVS
jgi:hypothetical protein